MIDQLAIQLCSRLAPKVVDGAKAGYKAHRAKQDLELARALSEISLDKRRLTVVSSLKEKGITDTEAERVMSIFRSDAGVEAVRQIIIYNLALTPNKDTLDLLYRSIQSLLSLNEGQEFGYHLDAATVLTVTFVEAMTALKAQLTDSSLGRELYRDLQAEARHRRLENALFGKSSVNNRVPRLAALMAANVNVSGEDENHYANALLAENSEIEVPTLSSKQVSLPFEEGYVMPSVTFQQEGSQAFTDSLYDYIAQRRNVVILGDPGAGKSTAIKHLAREFVSNHQKAPHEPLPFIVTLRHYAEARAKGARLGFIEFISNQLSEEYHSSLDRQALTYLLHVGRAAIFFDGFDEIIDFDLRKSVALSIAKIAYAFPSSIFVTSAREVGYDQNPVPRFSHRAYVGPFDDDGVTKFVDNYLITTNTQGDLSSKKFMLETTDIADLRSSPLLLGVLCSLYSLGRTMPNNRAELYAKCGEMIFDAWDTRKSIVIPFEYRRLAEDAVRSLALKTFSEGVEEMRESELKQFLESFYHDNVSQSRAAKYKFAADTLDRWKGRMWILVYVGTEDGEDYFRFAHRSFLEFFAAEQTVYDSEDGRALWQKLVSRFETRVAVSYSLICVELLGSRSRGALDGFYKKATTRIRKLCRAGKTFEGLNLATSMFEALACTRSNLDPRRTLMIECILAFAQAIPYIKLSDPDHLHLFNDGIGYSQVFNASINDGIPVDPDASIDVEQLAQYSVENVTIQSAASMFQSLARLRDIDRDAAISALTDAVHQSHADDIELALRLTMTLQQIPAFETWRAMRADLRGELHDVATELWDELTSDLSPETVRGFDDLWLRIALLRDGKPCWGELLERTSLLVLFESGWPFPVDPASGLLLDYEPSVYMVVQALFGLVDDDQVGEILASERERQAFARAFALEDQDLCFSVQPHLTPGFTSVRYCALRLSAEREPADLELWVSFCLLAALDRLGDRSYIESFVAAARESPALARMVNLRERVRSAENPKMFLGSVADIELRNEAQVAECLSLFETISDLAGLES